MFSLNSVSIPSFLMKSVVYKHWIGFSNAKDDYQETVRSVTTTYNEVSNVCLTHIVIKILFTNEEAKKVVKHAFKVNKSSVKKDNDTDPKTHIFAILLFQWKAC